MRSPALLLLAIVLASPGCETMVAPSDRDTVARPAATDLVTISGWVYAMATWADPPLADARVEVVTADGLSTAVESDASGFYELTVPRGTGIVSITTTKSGYRPQSAEVEMLLKETVLNFFLSPV